MMRKKANKRMTRKKRGMWQPLTGLIPRGCRVEHRRMGAPMVGFDMGWESASGAPDLTLAPTSLCEDVNPRPGGLTQPRQRT